MDCDEMTTKTTYVEISEHDTDVCPVPFTHMRDRIPGRFNVGILYGPYTPAGAERVARRALAQVSDTVTTYPKSGNRYATDDDGTRVVKVWPRMPYGWRAARRNMPADGAGQ